MLKRIFWLALAAVAGWLLWRLWQQRQDNFGALPPQLAPLEPIGRPAPFGPPAALPPTPSAETATPVQQPERKDAEPTTSSASRASAATGIVPAEAAADERQRAEPVVEEPLVQEAPAGDLGEVIGYCPRCKTKRPISHAHEETTESGRRAARGTCPVCGGNMFTFLRKEVPGE
jgi:hypothetical protein